MFRIHVQRRRTRMGGVQSEMFSVDFVANSSAESRRKTSTTATVPAGALHFLFSFLSSLFFFFLVSLFFFFGLLSFDSPHMHIPAWQGERVSQERAESERQGSECERQPTSTMDVVIGVSVAAIRAPACRSSRHI